MRGWKSIGLAVALAALLGAAEAHAEPLPAVASTDSTFDPEAAFEALMGAIDSLPRDANELTAWLPDARLRLARAAADPSRTTGVRIRSLQLLLYFPEAVPDVLALVRDSDAMVRGAAIYALARAHARAPRRAQAAIERAAALGLADPDRDVRAASARALRWLVAPRRP